MPNAGQSTDQQHALLISKQTTQCKGLILESHLLSCMFCFARGEHYLGVSAQTALLQCWPLKHTLFNMVPQRPEITYGYRLITCCFLISIVPDMWCYMRITVYWYGNGHQTDRDKFVFCLKMVCLYLKTSFWLWCLPQGCKCASVCVINFPSTLMIKTSSFLLNFWMSANCFYVMTVLTNKYLWASCEDERMSSSAEES